MRGFPAQPYSPRPHGLDVVVLAASLGGVEALKRFFSLIPADFGAPIVVVQHMSPHHQSHLDRIIRRVSKLPVDFARHGDRLTPGRVYLAPTDRHIVIRENSTLALLSDEKVNFTRPAADPLFSSAARFGTRALGIVLTGRGSDGARGTQDIRAAGGIVLVQDLASCQAPQMPQASKDWADAILPIDALASAAVALAGFPITRAIFGLPRQIAAV